jgi:hypothetical protein
VVEGRYDHPGVWLVFLLPVFWGLYLAVNEFKKKVIFLDHEVEIHSLRDVKRVPFDSIKGCRIIRDRRLGKSIILVTDNPELKEVRLPSRLNEDTAFSNWVALLPDMDKADFRASEAAIIGSGSDWLAPEERKKKLSGARRNAITLTVFGGAVFFWGCMAQETLFIAAWILAAIPWMAMALAATERSHYALWFKRNDPRGPLGLAIALPGLLLAARILAGVDVLDWKDVHAFVLIFVALMALAVTGLDSSIRNPAAIVLLVLALVPYGYGTLELLDIAADESAGQTYQTEVLDKYSTSGGHGSHTYTLTLGPWGPVRHNETRDVLWPLYNSLSKGDIACVRLHDGYLGLPWYKVSACMEGQKP